jgi:hypothetical protein
LFPKTGQAVFGKLILPEGDPAFDRETWIRRRAEEMQMIGHQEVVDDPPISLHSI